MRKNTIRNSSGGRMMSHLPRRFSQSRAARAGSDCRRGDISDLGHEALSRSMSNPRKKSPTAPAMPRARNAHGRQRQRLIDACISALHIYGPSRTTVEKVVAIAEMSPGIVRFYFASKAAMLVASLQFLAAEFEEQLLVPVARLKIEARWQRSSCWSICISIRKSPVRARCRFGIRFGARRVHARNITIFAARKTRALPPWCASSSSG